MVVNYYLKSYLPGIESKVQGPQALYEIISILRQSAIVLDFDVLELIELLIKQYEG